MAVFGGAVFVRRGIADGHLTEAGREVIRSVAEGVLDALLPAEAGARKAALDAHVVHMERFLTQLPPALRNELSALIGVLGNAAGRVALTGMTTRWANASAAEVQRALEKLRLSPLATVQMVYHGLRDINSIAFFNASENWKLAGYSGPLDI